MNLVPFRYERKWKTAQKTARPSWWAVSKLLSRLLKIVDQYLVGLSILSYFFCHRTHFIWRPRTSVSRAYHPLLLGKTNVRVEMSFSCKVSWVVSSSSINCLWSFACDLRSITIKGDGMLARLRTDRRSALQKPMIGRSSDYLVGISKSCIESLV